MLPPPHKEETSHGTRQSAQSNQQLEKHVWRQIKVRAAAVHTVPNSEGRAEADQDEGFEVTDDAKKASGSKYQTTAKMHWRWFVNEEDNSLTVVI